MLNPIVYAPGQPGIPPKWTSSAKSGIGTAVNPSSQVWFSVSHGILNEIYYPGPDRACTRDMGFLVTDGEGFFSEEKRHTSTQFKWFDSGIPAFEITNTCFENRYSIFKEILTDPFHDVVLQRNSFVPLKGLLGDYHVYVLLSPHLGNRGSNNTAWVGDYKGMPMLFAEREGIALALACSAPWIGRSVGFVGASDGWQDISLNKKMTWDYTRAENGNVALTGEIDLKVCDGKFLLALGFGRNVAEAGLQARTSLLQGFDEVSSVYVKEWKKWHEPQLALSDKNKTGDFSLYNTSLTVMKIHEDKEFLGGFIASLSIPWGMNKGDDDLGGYHLIWPRDLVETAGGFLASGFVGEVREILNYLAATQLADGHWSQNMWLDGTPYWDGVQMDETAFPILLVDLAIREKVIKGNEFWPMVLKAAGYLAQNGPVTQQDRWEEDPGYSPFTLSVEISALLTAADLADLNHFPGIAKYLRETADVWNANIESWTYVTGTELAKKAGVEGYYVRIAPPEQADAASPKEGFVPIKNRPYDHSLFPAEHIISPDALALVRFGLRSPHDPRVVNTVKVIDALLKTDTPFGPGWHRYNGDGYGEHEDGTPFDGMGIGRLWPLLNGERGHYELAAGHKKEAENFLKVLADFSNEGGMIPEQIWDSPDIKEKELFWGKPSGSAMPLVWAHAEYVKLLRSIRDGKIFDRPRQTYKRYVENKNASSLALWRFNHKCRMLSAGKTLRLETLSPALVHWSSDEWRTAKDVKTTDTGLGVYTADLDTHQLEPGREIVFTFYWIESDKWEGADFNVGVVADTKKTIEQSKPRGNSKAVIEVSS